MDSIDTLNTKLAQSLKVADPKLSLAIRQGKIRVDRIEDTTSSISDLMGDLFDTKYCTTEQDLADMKREKEQFRKRIYNQKVWIYAMSFWNSREWMDSDCIGGFVGYDFFGSNYDIDLARIALESYEKQHLDDEGFVVDPYRSAA